MNFAGTSLCYFQIFSETDTLEYVSVTNHSPHDYQKTEFYRDQYSVSHFSSSLLTVLLLKFPSHSHKYTSLMTLAFTYTNNLQQTHRLLQKTIQQIQIWTTNHRFRSSATKTSLVILHRQKTIPRLSPLLIRENQIPLITTTKFLGIYFDSRLSWLPHIEKTKDKCLRYMNVLKYLAHPNTGCSRNILLHTYQTMIRPIHDYSSPIYEFAAKSHLKLLDTIQTTCIRIATGAFRTSPSLCLLAKLGFLPLTSRRFHIAAKIILTIPNNQSLLTYEIDLLHNQSRRPDIKISTYLRSHLEAELTRIFNYTSLLNTHNNTPPWFINPFDYAILQMNNPT